MLRHPVIIVKACKWQHNLKLWLFLDACYSDYFVRAIRDAFADSFLGEENFKVAHLTEYFKADEDDSKWIPELAKKDADWIVLTKDRGYDPKKARLPLLCEKHQITHMALCAAMSNEGQQSMKEAILVSWPQIRMLPSLPKGSKTSLGYRAFKKHATHPIITFNNQPLFTWCSENEIPILDWTERRPKKALPSSKRP